MASYQFLSHLNQVRDSSCSSSNIGHGFSKSQMCLQKILQIIASYPPHETSKEASLNPEIVEFEESRGLGIDLNMGLSPWPEAKGEEDQLITGQSLLIDCSFVEKAFKKDSPVEFSGVCTVRKSSSEGEYDAKEIEDKYGTDSSTIQAIGEESGVVGERILDSNTIDGIDEAEISHVKEEEDNKKEQDDDDDGVKALVFRHEEEKNKSIDYFSLLIEAAEMVSGNLEDKESSDSEKTMNEAKSTATGSKRQQCSTGVVDLYEGLDDMSPVVKSKRGRSQVLPYRYRDSVLLEPWKRQRSSTSANEDSTTKRKVKVKEEDKNVKVNFI